MPGPRRKRLFGPLFYSTLVGAVLTLIYVGMLQVPDWLGDRWRSIAERSQIEELSQGLRSPVAAVRDSSVQTLLAKGSQVYRPIMIGAANDPSEPVRLRAASCLGQFVVAGLSPPEGLDDDTRRALRGLLKDPSSRVRAMAANSIGTYGPDPKIAGDLVTALGDKDRSVQFAAARSLIQVNGPDDPSAARVLIAMIAGHETNADRRDVLRAIGLMSPPVRDRAAGEIAGLIRNTDPEILADLLAALAEAGIWAKSVEPAIEPLLDHSDPDIRAWAALVISVFECPATAPFLPVGNSNGMIREALWPGFNPAVRESLINPKVAAILGRVIGDPMISKNLRLSAIELIQLAGPSAITRATPELVRQLTDADPSVRMAAIELLDRLVNQAPAALPSANPSR